MLLVQEARVRPGSAVEREVARLGWHWVAGAPNADGQAYVVAIARGGELTGAEDSNPRRQKVWWRADCGTPVCLCNHYEQVSPTERQKPATSATPMALQGRPAS